MPHIIEIAILLLLVFLIGCVIGYFVRMRLFSGTIAKSEVEGAEAPPTAKPAPSQPAVPLSATSSAPPPPAKKTSAKPATGAAKKTTAARQKTKPASVKAKPAKAQPATKASPSAAKPAAKTSTKPKVATKPKPVVKSSGEMAGRPETLSAPRAGGKDDLKRLSGVGPKLEATLNGLGIYHFDQIASWDHDAVAWVDDNLSFKGRIDREGWIAQAAKLVAEK